MEKCFYIIDGSSYMYRAYYAIRELTNSAGLPTNAVYGFTQMLLKIIKEKSPDYIAIAFDARGPTFRHEVYEDYKADRPSMPDSLAEQIPYIDKMVAAFQIPLLKESGLEADDLIGTLARKGESAGLKVVVVTGDKDMYQLISPTVTVYDSMKEKVYTEESIREKFGIEPDQIVEMMGLMGDKVDNIPGVMGIGQKTAVSLIQQFASIENLLENLDQVKRPKLRQSLEKEGETARLSKELATIKTDCSIDFNLKTFETQSPDLDQLIPLCQELEFASLLKAISPAPPKAQGTYRILTDALLPEVVKEIAEKQEVALTCITDAKGPMEAKMIGLAFSSKPGSGYYLPLPDQNLIPSSLKKLLSSDSIAKLGHDLKLATILFHKNGIDLHGKMFDTQIASYLLNPGKRDHSLESVSLEYLQKQLPPLEQSNAKDEAADNELLAASLCRRAEVILRLSHILPSELKNQSLSTLFEEMEMPLVSVLADIEAVGVQIDLEGLKEMSIELEEKLASLKQTIHDLAGGEFNINSPKQLAEILFNRLDLTPIKKTKTGYSTNEEVLKQLSTDHPLPAEILNSRHLSKLKSTYIDALPKLINPLTGRVHTQLNQTIAATGRLSSKDPNLQNIPIRGALGQRIRATFIAAQGNVLLSVDYNQVELRILAHLSDDPKLVESFKKGEDVHTRTAIEIFGLAKEEITSEMRRVAKSVNFGIIYGISPFGLSNNLGISLNESKRYIDLYFEHYHGVKTFIEKTLKEATENGYVTTLFNRRRQIPDLASQNSFKRGVGERLAMNTPVQGSAADIIKLAMISIWQWMKKEKLQSKMTLQVHDELLFDVPEDEVDVMKKEVVERMENVVTLKVPLKVDAGVGLNWGEAH